MNHKAQLSENLWSLRGKMLRGQSAFIHVFVFPVNLLKHGTSSAPTMLKILEVSVVFV